MPPHQFPTSSLVLSLFRLFAFQTRDKASSPPVLLNASQYVLIRTKYTSFILLKSCIPINSSCTRSVTLCLLCSFVLVPIVNVLFEISLYFYSNSDFRVSSCLILRLLDEYKYLASPLLSPVFWYAL